MALLFTFAASSSGPQGGGGNDLQWYFSQVKGTMDEDVSERKQNLLYYNIIIPTSG